jgi:hypothetical protein
MDRACGIRTSLPIAQIEADYKPQRTAGDGAGGHPEEVQRGNVAIDGNIPHKRKAGREQQSPENLFHV